MFAKILRTLVVVICSATTIYEVNIASTAALASVAGTGGSGAGAAR